MIDAVGGDWIKAGGRLITKQDFRLIHNGSSQSDPFSHPSGESGGLFVLRSFQINHGQSLIDLAFDFLSCPLPFPAQCEGHVVGDGHRIEECRSLEEHSESVAHGQKLPFGHGYDILSVDDYFARVRSDESNYQLKEYTFAAAASSDNHDPFALLDMEADASEH